MREARRHVLCVCDRTIMKAASSLEADPSNHPMQAAITR